MLNTVHLGLILGFSNQMELTGKRLKWKEEAVADGDITLAHCRQQQWNFFQGTMKILDKY